MNILCDTRMVIWEDTGLYHVLCAPLCGKVHYTLFLRFLECAWNSILTKLLLLHCSLNQCSALSNYSYLEIYNIERSVGLQASTSSCFEILRRRDFCNGVQHEEEN